MDELGAEFNELILDDAPIEISGFGTDEIDEIVIGDDEPSDRAPAPGLDQIPPRADAPVARVGGLFRLGPHRLISGDARDPAVLQRLMQSGLAQPAFTDLVPAAATTGSGKLGSRSAPIALAAPRFPGVRCGLDRSGRSPSCQRRTTRCHHGLAQPG